MRITNIIITTQHLDIFPRWALTKARWGTVRAFQRTIRDVRIIHLNIKEYAYPEILAFFLHEPRTKASLDKMNEK